jgi:hypothetical protein
VVRHVTYANKSLLTGDEAADLLVRYAATLADQKRGDAVRLNTISADGNLTETLFLLDTGAPLLSETTNSGLPDPDNAAAVAYMRGKLTEFAQPAPTSDDDAIPDNYEDLRL